MSEKPISPLRQRMIEDMTVRKFGEKTQSDYIRSKRACVNPARSRRALWPISDSSAKPRTRGSCPVASPLAIRSAIRRKFSWSSAVPMPRLR